MQPKLSLYSLCDPSHRLYSYTHLKRARTKRFSPNIARCRCPRTTLLQVSFTIWCIYTGTEQWSPSKQSINLSCSTLHRSWSSGPFGVDGAHDTRGLVPCGFRCHHSTSTFTFYSALQRQSLKRPQRSPNSPPCRHGAVALQFISQQTTQSGFKCPPVTV